MPKKLLVFSTIIVLLVLCAVIAPWQSWDLSLPRLLGVIPPEKFARLQVSSLAGEIEISIDGELKGSVGPEGSPFIIEDVKPGQRLVKLERKTAVPGSYISFERLLNFSEDIDVVTAYELGPSDEFSEGHFITGYKNYANADKTRLNITTKPEGVSVTLDATQLGSTPLTALELDVSTQHKLKLQKQGYEVLEINLLPDSEDARNKLKGYDLNLDANLFLIPIRVE